MRWAAAALALAVAAPAAAVAQGFDTLLEQAATARTAGDFATAEALLRRALDERPANVDALRRLGTVLAFQQEYAEAESVLARARELAPDDGDVALAHARVLVWTERYDEAAAVVEAELARRPENVEALTLRGRIAYYQGRLTPAAAWFDRALAVAPQDLEALLGRGDVAAAAGDTAAAERLYRQAEAVDPGSRDVQQRLAGLEAPQPDPWRVDLSGSVSSFDDDARDDWRQAELAVGYRMDAATAVYGRATVAHRFGATDTALAVGGSRRLGERLTLRGEASGAPGAEFLPRWDVTAGAAYTLQDGGGWLGPTVLDVEGRYRRYIDTEVAGLSPGLMQYFADRRLWLTARWINTWDEDKRRAGWSVRADWRATDGLALYAGTANAPEAENGIVAESTTVFGGLVARVTPVADLRLGIAREDRGSDRQRWRRTEVTGGLTLRF